MANGLVPIKGGLRPPSDVVTHSDQTVLLRLTAQDLRELGVCDQIIGEPLGGAHRDRQATIQDVGRAISQLLGELAPQAPADLVSNRRKKYLAIGSTGLAA